MIYRTILQHNPFHKRKDKMFCGFQNCLLALLSLFAPCLMADLRFSTNSHDQASAAEKALAEKALAERAVAEQFLNLYLELDHDHEGIAATASLKWLSELTGRISANAPSGSLRTSKTDVRWNQTGWFYEFCQAEDLQPVISGAVSLQQTDSGRVRAYPASDSGSFSITINKPSVSFASCQRLVAGSTSVPVLGEETLPHGNTLAWSELKSRESGHADHFYGGVLVSLLLSSAPVLTRQNQNQNQNQTTLNQTTLNQTTLNQTTTGAFGNQPGTSSRKFRYFSGGADSNGADPKDMKFFRPGGDKEVFDIEITPLFKQKQGYYQYNGKQFIWVPLSSSEPPVKLVRRNLDGSEVSRTLPQEIVRVFFNRKNEYNPENWHQLLTAESLAGPLQTIRRCSAVLTAGQTPVDGGTKKGGNDSSGSRSSKPSDSDSQRPLRKRENPDSRPPAAKRKRAEGSEGGGDQGGQQQKDISEALTPAQMAGEFNQQLLLDMAWSIKDDFELLKRASGFMSHVTDTLPGDQNYDKVFYLLKKFIEQKKIEHVCQLIDAFSSPDYQRLQENLIGAVQGFREELVQTEGVYSDFHAQIILKKKELMTDVVYSHVLGLHLGLSPQQIPFHESRLIFSQYKRSHPNMLLSTFFPRLKKGLTRINKEQLYTDICALYTDSVNKRKPKQRATSRSKNTTLKVHIEKEELAHEDITPHTAISLGSFEIAPQLPAIPNTVLLRIFSFLDLKSLAQCRGVCRSFLEGLNDLELHSMNPEMTQYVGTHYERHNKARRAIKNQFWFKYQNWYEVLERQGTNPELVRRCKQDSYLLKQVLAKTLKLYEIKRIIIDERRLAIHTISTPHLQPSNNPPISALAVGDKRMAPLLAGAEEPLKAIYQLRVDTRKHWQWQGTGLFINYQHKAVSLQSAQLYLTTGYSRRLSLWDFSCSKMNCLTGSCDVKELIHALAIMNLETSTVVIIGDDTPRLTVWDIDISGQGKTFSLVSSLKLRATVKRLLPLSNNKHHLASLDYIPFTPPNLGLWELGSQKILRMIHSRPAFPFEVEKNDNFFKMSIKQCGEVILTLSESGYLMGWSLDINNLLFKKDYSDRSSLEEPRMFYSSFDLAVFSDNRFAMMLNSDLYVFKIANGQIEDEPQKLDINMFKTHSTWEKSIAAVSKDLFLLGDQHGGVSLWWIPEDDLQP